MNYSDNVLQFNIWWFFEQHVILFFHLNSNWIKGGEILAFITQFTWRNNCLNDRFLTRTKNCLVCQTHTHSRVSFRLFLYMILNALLLCLSFAFVLSIIMDSVAVPARRRLFRTSLWFAGFRFFELLHSRFCCCRCRHHPLARAPHLTPPGGCLWDASWGWPSVRSPARSSRTWTAWSWGVPRERASEARSWWRRPCRTRSNAAAWPRADCWLCGRRPSGLWDASSGRSSSRSVCTGTASVSNG